MAPKIILLEGEYILEVGDERSEPVPFGEPIEVEFSSGKYLAMVDLPEGSDEAEDVESKLPAWAYKLAECYGDEVEVEDEDDDDDDDEAEEEPEIKVP